MNDLIRASLALLSVQAIYTRVIILRSGLVRIVDQSWSNRDVSYRPSSKYLGSIIKL